MKLFLGFFIFEQLNHIEKRETRIQKQRVAAKAQQDNHQAKPQNTPRPHPKLNHSSTEHKQQRTNQENRETRQKQIEKMTNQS